MNKQISEQLEAIEKQHNVRIIYACESGSRAWGFPSKDSDYDVRFIYMHPLDWYLSIAEKRDVIELPVDEVLDINGWDLRKALKLLKKSNSPLQEWLSSPIKYKSIDTAVNPLVELAKKAFLPETSFHHYLSMTINKVNQIQENNTVKLKTYLYALRPLLCCIWIIKYKNQPPMIFQDLLNEFLPNGETREYIDHLLEAKKNGTEKDEIERSAVLDKYLENAMAEANNSIPKNLVKLSIDAFDTVFKEILYQDME